MCFCAFCCSSINFLRLSSWPSVVMVMVPHSPVVRTVAPFACQRWTTSWCGWPNIELRPTEMIARCGLVARTKSSVEDVLLP